MIDLDTLYNLVKHASAPAPQDTPGGQAMAAAAKIATPPGAPPMPQPVESSQSEATAVDPTAEQQKHLQDIAKKDKEIQDLRTQTHELKLDLQRMQMTSELQKQQQAMLDKVRAEQKLLDKKQTEFHSHEAAHKANLEKETARHEVMRAKADAKSLADIANRDAESIKSNAEQNAKNYVKMVEDARKTTDSYMASKEKAFAQTQEAAKKNSPYVSVSLRSNIDGALAAAKNIGKLRSRIAKDDIKFNKAAAAEATPEKTPATPPAAPKPPATPAQQPAAPKPASTPAAPAPAPSIPAQQPAQQPAAPAPTPAPTTPAAQQPAQQPAPKLVQSEAMRQRELEGEHRRALILHEYGQSLADSGDTASSADTSLHYIKGREDYLNEQQKHKSTTHRRLQLKALEAARTANTAKRNLRKAHNDKILNDSKASEQARRKAQADNAELELNKKTYSATDTLLGKLNYFSPLYYLNKGQKWLNGESDSVASHNERTYEAARRGYASAEEYLNAMKEIKSAEKWYSLPSLGNMVLNIFTGIQDAQNNLHISNAQKADIAKAFGVENTMSGFEGGNAAAARAYAKRNNVELNSWKALGNVGLEGALLLASIIPGVNAFALAGKGALAAGKLAFSQMARRAAAAGVKNWAAKGGAHMAKSVAMSPLKALGALSHTSARHNMSNMFLAKARAAKAAGDMVKYKKYINHVAKLRSMRQWARAADVGYFGIPMVQLGAGLAGSTMFTPKRGIYDPSFMAQPPEEYYDSMYAPGALEKMGSTSPVVLGGHEWAGDAIPQIRNNANTVYNTSTFGTIAKVLSPFISQATGGRINIAPNYALPEIKKEPVNLDVVLHQLGKYKNSLAENSMLPRNASPMNFAPESPLVGGNADAEKVEKLLSLVNKLN